MLEHFVPRDTNTNINKAVTQEEVYAKLKQLLAPFVVHMETFVTTERPRSPSLQG